MKLTSATIRLYLAITLTGLGLVMFAYVAVQQSLRLGANAVPQQLAEDTAAKLADGLDPGTVVGPSQVVENTSLAPFVTIVDSHLNVRASSGVVGGHVPLPPSGSFTFASQHGINKITWQHDGVRDATVIVPFHYQGQTGYVLAARSLRLTEGTIDHITLLAGLTALGVLVVPMVVFLAI